MLIRIPKSVISLIQPRHYIVIRKFVTSCTEKVVQISERSRRKKAIYLISKLELCVLRQSSIGQGFNCFRINYILHHSIRYQNSYLVGSTPYIHVYCILLLKQTCIRNTESVNIKLRIMNFPWLCDFRIYYARSGSSLCLSLPMRTAIKLTHICKIILR